MNFIEAINLLDTDTVKSVRKSSWQRGKYIFIDNDVSWRLTVTLDKPNCMTLPYSASIDDILDRDWEIYKKEKKEIRLHTFVEALDAYKLGYTIYRESIKDVKYTIGTLNPELRIKDIYSEDWVIKKGDQND